MKLTREQVKLLAAYEMELYEKERDFKQPAEDVLRIDANPYRQQED
jgi:hypothetical protein